MIPNLVEVDIFRVKPSFLPYLAIIIAISLVGGIIASAILSFIPLITYVVAIALVFIDSIVIFSWQTTVYGLTNQRLDYRFGIIGSKKEFIETSRISSVEIHQGFLGKVLNYGDIVVEGDNPDSVFNFRNIAKPKFRLEQIKTQTIENEE